VDAGAEPPSTGGVALAFVPAPVTGTSPTQRGRDIHVALLQRYAALLAAKEAVSNRPSGTVASADLQDARRFVAEAAARIHAQLQEHGLEETSLVVGELRTGPVVTSSGAFGSSSSTSADQTGGQVLAHVVWQTAHAGAHDKTSGSDVSAEGQFGLQPALTLIKTTVAGQQQLAAQFQQGLIVDAGLGANAFTGNTEFSALARGGFVRFGQLAQVFESNGANYLAVPGAWRSCVYLRSADEHRTPERGNSCTTLDG